MPYVSAIRYEELMKIEQEYKKLLELSKKIPETNDLMTRRLKRIEAFKQYGPILKTINANKHAHSRSLKHKHLEWTYYELQKVSTMVFESVEEEANYIDDYYGKGIWTYCIPKYYTDQDFEDAIKHIYDGYVP